MAATKPSDASSDKRSSIRAARLLSSRTGRAVNRRIAGFNKLGKIVAGTIHHPIIVTITRDQEFAEPAPGFGAHVAQAKDQHREQTRRHRDTRAAEQTEGERMLREARLRALAEEEIEEAQA
jgi:hypothetical protein